MIQWLLKQRAKSRSAWLSSLTASGTDALSIDPDSPWRNGIVESFNGRLRDELLSSEILATLDEARLLADQWRLHYNHRRIQRALGKLTPAAFAAACLAATMHRHSKRVESLRATRSEAHQSRLELDRSSRA